ncbi:MAG: hypothetical protein ACD_73C00121G0003 [uncultured bacterium]|nr:MAG: hypothetical protein ACD_73C00121G0003 [uncultured bacterium]
MADSSDEKTEDATPKRLREAREKGQVPKSKDISQVLILITIFATMAFMMTYMAGEFKQFFKLAFETVGHREITGALMWDVGKAGFFTFIKALTPIFLAGVVVALFSGYIQVGAMFTMDPLTPKFEKLNPVEGLKNMFKVVTLIELFKNMIKISVVLYIAYSAIYKRLDSVMMTYRINILDSARIAGDIITEFIVKTSAIFIFISIADYMLQRWNFMKNMKMSKDEVKREYKQDEGDPQIKGERRRLHREMAFSDAKQAVKKSDAVITNPVHVAVAIEYKKDEMGAPQITYKGQEAMAQMIVEIAREENIPIMRNIPLAWSLVQLEIGDEIPEDLYEAVAEILTVIYEMKQKDHSSSDPPTYA